MKRILTALLLAIGVACGGAGGGDGSGGGNTGGTNAWAPVSAAAQAALPKFSNGLCVEILSPAGVVYSQSFGGMTNTTSTLVASGSKWVSASVILQLVDQGELSLDTKTKDLLTDRNGNPWSGNMGEITLRHLLSFTSGITGDDDNSESLVITLDEAVKRIYEDQASVASVPGSYFYYGNTHLRIAARMAELATGKTWKQIFDEQLRVPMGWSSDSIYSGGIWNPNLAGGLRCTGQEYVRFLAMQLHQGMDGTRRALSASAISTQRGDAYGPSTTISYSPYVQRVGKTFHYGLGNWLETAGGGAPSAGDPVIRWSSTGTFGWAPWVAADGSYAAVIMTQQPLEGMTVPSEDLKNQLDPLIRAALATNPPVIRAVP